MSKTMEKDETTQVPRLRFPEFQDAGAWEENTFGGVATFFNGRAYNQNELLEDGKYRVLRVGNFFSNNEWYYSDLELDENKYCDNGDLLYAWSASFGPRIWKGEKVIYHYHIWKVVENQGIAKQFLFLLLDYETQRMKAKSTNGLGLLHITKGAIEAWKCYLPRIKEQQKIADCLSSLDVLIAAQAEKLGALKAHKKGLMQQLFPREGETLPQLRFPEFQDAGEWQVKALGDVAKITSGGTPNRAEPSYWGGSIPWITTTLIDFNRIENSEEFITIEGMNNSSAKLFPAQTLLMAMYGQGKTRGKVALMSIEATTNQACAAILLSDEVDVNFAFQNLASRYDEIRKLSNEGGQENLSAGLIKSIILVYPCLTEQRKIADCLSSLDARIAAQAEKIDTLKAHKKGLMQQLFPITGETSS